MRSSFPRVLVILLTAALITAAALVLAFTGVETRGRGIDQISQRTRLESRPE